VWIGGQRDPTPGIFASVAYKGFTGDFLASVAFARVINPVVAAVTAVAQTD
jgi:hypothetical protein